MHGRSFLYCYQSAKASGKGEVSKAHQGQGNGLSLNAGINSVKLSSADDEEQLLAGVKRYALLL